LLKTFSYGVCNRGNKKDFLLQKFYKNLKYFLRF